MTAKPLTVAETITLLQSFDQKAYMMIASDGFAARPFIKEMVSVTTVVHHGVSSVVLPSNPSWPIPEGWTLEYDRPYNARILDRFPGVVISN